MTKPPAVDEWRVLGVRSIYESKWIKLSLAEVELPSGQHFEQTGPHALSAPLPSRCAIMGYPYGGVAT